MLFASDLDRTLIYSKKFLHTELKEKVKLVETKDKKEISYMLNSSINILKILTGKLLFVPVTTRSIKQYNRIDIFKSEIKPKYFIVSNGGNIFLNGKLDKEWNKIINNKFGKDCLSLEDVYNGFNKFKLNVDEMRIVDDLFFYCVLNEKISKHDFRSFSKWLENNNWRTIQNGRKLYFFPNHVNKGDAVKYVADKEGIKKIITSGDSLVDYDMAKFSKIFITPQHGTLSSLRSFDENIVKFTEESGLYASYEILNSVLKEVI